MVTQGPQVEVFEYGLKRWLDVKNLLTVNSGTSALQLAVKLAGVEHGDYVFSTPMTCTATNTAIVAMGGNIHWVDIDFINGNMDPDDLLLQIEAAKRHNVFHMYKAIMAVDWGGQPCDWDRLRKIADENNLKLIEDAAHAFGAKYNDEYLGRIADFTCYSFQAIKHLTTVDGGALICKSDADHERGKLLRWFGIDRTQPRKDFRCEADVVEAGYKYHMNDLNAAIGVAQLTHMEDIVSRHQRNGAFYDAFFHSNPIIYGKGFRRLPNAESSYWIYTIHVPDRDNFMHAMANENIVTSQVHARNDLHTMFQKYYRGPLNGVNSFAATQVNIPVGWWLDFEDVAHIAKRIDYYYTRIP